MLQKPKEVRRPSAKLQAAAATRAVKSYLLVAIGLGANYGSQDIEHYVLYSLLAERHGCNFAAQYSMVIAIVISTQLISRPLSGRLLDARPEWTRTGMIISSLGQLVAELLIIFAVGPVIKALDGSTRAFLTSIIVLQTLRNFFFVHLYNSLWKVLKLRITNRFTNIPGSQCAIIGKVFVCAEVWEIALLGVIFLVLWVGQFYYAWSFMTQKYAYVSMMLGFSGVSIISSVLIDDEYFLHPISSNHNKVSRRSIDHEDPFATPLNGSFGDRESVPEKFSNKKGMQDASSPLLSRGTLFGTLPLFGEATDDLGGLDGDSILAFVRADETFPDNARGENETVGVKRGLADVFGSPVARSAIVFVSWLAISSAVVSNAMTLLVPAGSHHRMAGKNDGFMYCGGYFVDASLQAAIINAFYLAGAAFYWFVLKRTDPLSFFAIAYPIAGFIFTGTLVALEPALRVPQIAANVMVAIVLGFVWFYILYGQFAAAAVIRPRSNGTLVALVGTILAVCQLLSSLMVTLGVTQTAFATIALIAVVLGLVTSGLIGWTSVGRSALRRAGVGYC